MRRKLTLTLIAALSALTAGADGGHIFVYRNDANFNHFRHEAGIRAPGGTFQLTCGDTSVPLEVIDSCTVRATDIPVLRFTLPDYPDAETVRDKELYINAVLDIEGNGTTDPANALQLTIKGRGNSTWNMPKKPLRLKFPSKTSICGFAPAKSYVLLANYVDPTLMRNAVALWLARRLGVPYANHAMPCHVYINGNYQGAYLLTEKVGINSASVDIDKQTGMLFELSVEYDEPYKFRSEINKLPVMVKGSDFELTDPDNPYGATPEERLEKWKADFNRAERLAENGRAAEAFDVESAVNYMLLFDIIGNNEIGFPRSFFIHKNALGDTELYRLGPAWDFDVSCNFSSPDGAGGFKEADPKQGLWWNGLCGALLADPAISARYAARTREFIDGIYPELKRFIAEYSRLIEPSARENGVRWPDSHVYQGWAYVQPSFDTSRLVSALQQWLDARVEYLSARLNR